MAKIRVGVIGTGHLGTFHAKVYSTIEKRSGIELTGVCDIDKKAGKDVAKKYDTKYFSSHLDMMDKIDAASIVVPTVSHYEVAKDLILAGKHVLIEKPITKTVEEAEEIIALAKQKGVIIQVGHIERFNSAVRAIEPFLEKPRFIECQRLGSVKKKGRIKDVGVVLDLMIHDIDIILALVGSKVKNIEAIGMSTVSEHEDMANVRLSFQNNMIADITASRVTREETRKIRIFQENSYILLDYMHQEAFIFKRDGRKLLKKKIPIRKKEPLKAELKSFIECVRKKRRPLVSGQEGKQALLVALNILEKINHNHASLV